MSNKGANLHLEHIEDLIINDGAAGAKNVFAFFDELGKTFSGKKSPRFAITTKWDGAPAIFCGYLPGSKDWFIAKKGLFNKNPKLYRSKQEIEEDYPAGSDLHTIFALCLKHIKPLHETGKISGIVQGDFLFHKGTRKLETINGEKCVIFRPNVSGITYCIPDGDKLYNQAKNAELCVVFHTRYPTNTAKSLDDLGAEYAFNATDLSNNKLLILSSETTELGSNVMLTENEISKLKRFHNASSTLIRQCSSLLDEFSASMGDPMGVGPMLKVFINSYVRQGKGIPSATTFYNQYMEYYEDKFRKKIESYKKPETQAKWKKKFYSGRNTILNNKTAFLKFAALYTTIQNAKAIFVPKLERGERFKQYYEDGKGGYEIGAPEGYVAVREGTNAVKLIDRLVFSAKNFQR